MKKAAFASLVTINELAALVGRLEGTTLKDWHVRRYLSDVKPSIEGGHGRTRLYTIDDVCLVRLAVRLEREGLSAWTVRAAIVNHADELTRAWASKAPTIFAVRGVRGKVIPAATAAQLDSTTIAVPLHTIRRDLPRAMASIRQSTPCIPLFNRDVPVQDAIRAALDVPSPW